MTYFFFRFKTRQLPDENYQDLWQFSKLLKSSNIVLSSLCGKESNVDSYSVELGPNTSVLCNYTENALSKYR